MPLYDRSERNVDLTPDQLASARKWQYKALIALRGPNGIIKRIDVDPSPHSRKSRIGED